LSRYTGPPNQSAVSAYRETGAAASHRRRARADLVDTGLLPR
jgi:hypothetical protein